MGQPPHPRVTPSGKGGSWRPHRGGKPSSERRSAAGARLINLGPFQSRARPRPPVSLAPPLAAHSLPRSFQALAAGIRAPETPLCLGRQPRAPQLPGDKCRRPEGAERPSCRPAYPRPVGLSNCFRRRGREDGQEVPGKPSYLAALGKQPRGFAMSSDELREPM